MSAGLRRLKIMLFGAGSVVFVQLLYPRLRQRMDEGRVPATHRVHYKLLPTEMGCPPGCLDE